MIYSTAAQNSGKAELMPGNLLQLKNVFRQPQLLQCTVARSFTFQKLNLPKSKTY